MPGFLLDFIFQLVIVLAVTAVLVLNALWIIYYDRKISALMQIRKGPNRVGPFGLLQTLADTVKLLIKEDVNPKKIDILSFWIAPLIIFIPTFAVFLVLPFGNGLVPADLNIGILYIIAITGLSVIGILAAGWGSNNKYSLIGGMRSAAQIVSYEIPMVLVILAVVLMSGTMKMSGIVAAQSNRVWFVVPQFLGFIIFLIAGNAEVNRAPFDLPEAESELVAGFNTEYSAMKFAFFYLAEYTNLFLTSAVAATLFLGGWQGPFLPPIVWFFIKTYFVITILCWIRWTFPRIRVDQLMEFSWKYLLPLALLNLVVTAVILKF
jgi:NADH-quinone oxidoreductase subunit H